MKIDIDEAIKVLELDKTCDFEGDEQILEAALHLGIEALKKLKANREYGPMAGTGLLPGEADETTQLEKA